MSNLVFSKKERGQIALRFKTLYELVTAKTWTAGYMGLGYDMNATTDERRVRKLGQNGKMAAKGKLPEDGFRMCLVGAAAYVNGPTEKEIVALLATQIVLDDANNDKDGRKSHLEEKRTTDDDHPFEFGSDSEFALAVFEEFLTDDFQHSGIVNSSARWTCIVFNDDCETYKPIKTMIAKAQKLYDKLYAVWEIDQKHEKIIADHQRWLTEAQSARNKALAKVKL